MLFAKDLGASFVSSVKLNQEILRASRDCGVPILGGIESLSELQDALNLGVENIKIYPAHSMRDDSVKSLIGEASRNTNRCSIIVAGGVSKTNAKSYLDMGADGLAVGYDCKNVILSPFALPESLAGVVQACRGSKASLQ